MCSQPNVLILIIMPYGPLLQPNLNFLWQMLREVLPLKREQASIDLQRLTESRLKDLEQVQNEARRRCVRRLATVL